MGFLICPSCGSILEKEPLRYRCDQGHCFDRAKSGYVNLLMPGSKHSVLPGDNKLMVDARCNFLNQGYYAPLLSKLCVMAEPYLTKGETLLDAGCGEGYYTQGLYQYLVERDKCPDIAGIDISKLAVNKAAKRCREIPFAVASVFHLPIADDSLHMLLNLFAPFCQEEILRTLQPQGYFLMVIPGQHHLWELKQHVYDEPYQNQVKDTYLQGLELVDRQSLCWELFLSKAEDIDHLFKMTPYYYKTSRENYERLLTLKELKTTANFELLLYRKKDNCP